MSIIRLDKYLADAGYGTRSKVKEYIRKKRVLVNGEPALKADMKLDTETAEVVVDGKPVGYSEYEYYMLNKPQGVVSARTDNINKTVIELIAEKKRRDLFPVGRLDKDTEGLLIITNDGRLANSLLAPGKHVDKTYFVRVRGRVSDEERKLFEAGVDIGDEALTMPAEMKIISAAEQADDGVCISEVLLTIREGRYHQVKRMFEACDMEVVYLKRISMGALSLDEGLLPGEYRRLTAAELALLRAKSD